ncbi:MAG TPA: VCBS repeat-containing protein [Pyrinomonadaceae bacterium]|jgi:hypothetical protein
MKHAATNIIRSFLLSGLVLLLVAISVVAAPVIRSNAGTSAVNIQDTITLFRQDLGGANNGVGNSYTTGRREIDWDDVPDNLASPNYLPNNYYNSTSARGVIIDNPCNRADYIRVSADSSNATNTPVRFGDIDPSYTNNFKAYSGQRIFSPTDSSFAGRCSEVDINFYVPGTNIPATVNGFGAVFSDIDVFGRAMIFVYGVDGKRLIPSPTSTTALPFNNGLSFLGISFNSGERIARVRIYLSYDALQLGVPDENNMGFDVVAMDDIIYGEPRAIGRHSSDFDGDGTSDMSVFRPSNGVWYILNSGSNTFTSAQFGAGGDVPADGDFDGDSRNDLTVFRPSTGTWYSLRSTNNQVQILQFGAGGDKPVAGDYDKDGKTDFAVWRPADGNYYVYRSSDSQAQISHWGANGDIPIGSAANMP